MVKEEKAPEHERGQKVVCIVFFGLFIFTPQFKENVIACLDT